jgi:DNA repair and recombination protein RAD52
MTFTGEQKAALSSALGSSHVKQRVQGGRTVSYIEGWHAIAEANRIFGFDAWSRETVELKCVSEVAREIGQYKNPVPATASTETLATRTRARSRKPKPTL